MLTGRSWVVFASAKAGFSLRRAYKMPSRDSKRGTWRGQVRHQGKIYRRDFRTKAEAVAVVVSHIKLTGFF